MVEYWLNRQLVQITESLKQKRFVEMRTKQAKEREKEREREDKKIEQKEQMNLIMLDFLNVCEL